MSAPYRSRLLTATPVEEHGLLFPTPWIQLPAAAAAGTETATDPVGVTDSVTTDIASVQLIRPDADILTTGWETAPTPSQDHYAQLDEVTASDTDYVYLVVT